MDNPKLPPRLYYSLSQAAKELGCTEEYLLHLGATNRLELVLRGLDMVGAFPSKKGQSRGLAHGHPENPTAIFSDCFVCLSPADIEVIENGGTEGQDLFSNAYILDLGTTACAKEIDELQRIKNEDYNYVIFAALDLNDDPQSKNEFPFTTCILKYSANNLCIRNEELSRFKRGDAKPPLLSEGEIAQKAIAESQTLARYTTRLLRTQREAIQKFWVNYDPTQPDTAPDKETIKQWLMENGCSGNAADAIDLIIRHEGRKSGGAKPKG